MFASALTMRRFATAMILLYGSDDTLNTCRGGASCSPIGRPLWPISRSSMIELRHPLVVKKRKRRTDMFFRCSLTRRLLLWLRGSLSWLLRERFLRVDAGRMARLLCALAAAVLLGSGVRGKTVTGLLRSDAARETRGQFISSFMYQGNRGGGAANVSPQTCTDRSLLPFSCGVCVSVCACDVHAIITLSNRVHSIPYVTIHHNHRSQHCM